MTSTVTGELQSGVYIIRNIETECYITLNDGNSGTNLVTSRKSDDENVKWVIEKGADGSYTLKSNRWAHYAYTHITPKNNEYVKARIEKYKWDIREAQVGQFTISSFGNYDHLHFYFDNGNEGTRLRLTSESQGKFLRWSFIREREIRSSNNEASAPALGQPTDQPHPPSDASKAAGKARETDARSRIIFSVDVGTIHSIVSFLGPNSISPEPVKNWPHQESRKQEVPTRIYYRNREPCFYGADRPFRESDYDLVKEFKRQVHRLPTNPVSQRERDLLHGIGIDSVYQHWLQYLFQHAKAEFEKKYGTLVDPWRERQLVFTISNGWAVAEESLLSQAILNARCVEDKEHLFFVRESDATLHFLLKGNFLELEDGKEFMVCDAGGSTIDVALYSVTKMEPLAISEKVKAPSTSIEADLSLAYEEYCNSTSGIMVDGEDAQDNGEGIESEDETNILRPEINKIIEAINKLMQKHQPKLLVLAGGFCRIGVVYDALCEEYESNGMEVIRPESDKHNAVADGALSWFLRNTVLAHAAFYSFGCGVWTRYSNSLPGIEGRAIHHFPNGQFVDHGWYPIVQYGDLLQEGTKRRMGFTKMYDSKYAKLSKVEVDLYVAVENANPHWVFDSDENLMPGFRAITKLQANLSALERKLPKVSVPKRLPYYKLAFEVEIEFGAASLQATIIWKEKDKEQEVERRQTATFLAPSNAEHEWKLVQPQ